MTVRVSCTTVAPALADNNAGSFDVLHPGFYRRLMIGIYNSLRIGVTKFASTWVEDMQVGRSVDVEEHIFGVYLDALNDTPAYQVG